MINIILPITHDAQSYQSTLKFLAHRQDIRLIVGICMSLRDVVSVPKSAVVKEFQDESQCEEIINALQGYLDKGQTVIARRPFEESEFVALMQNEAQIVYCKTEKKNKFVSFWQNLIKKIYMGIFGVRFYEGDSSLIRFDSDLTEILMNVNNLSYCSRVDRWKGVEQAVIEPKKASVKPVQNRKRNITLAVVSAICILIPFAVTIPVALTVHVNLIGALGLASLFIIGFAVALFMLLTLFFNLKVGQRDVKKIYEL